MIPITPAGRNLSLSIAHTMFDGSEYSSASECYFSDTINNTESRRKKSSSNKRRFSDEQIRSLEVSFESENKLEPRKKAQLAKELGLQPRQVAIWFQNKRARWKSKQIEQDYSALLADYNNLASKLECLKKEKHSLLIQVQNLKNEMAKSEDKNLFELQEQAGNSSSDGESDDTKKIDLEANNISSKHLVCVFSDDEDSCIKAELMGLHDEENDHELLGLAEPALEGSLTSSEDWGTNLDSDDQSYDNQWWDFWC